MSFIVKPLSAIIDMPGLSFNISRKPEELVNWTSVMDPTNIGDIKLMAPLGVQATKNFTVL